MDAVRVQISFRYLDNVWSKEFTVRRGSTALELKELMVYPNGTRQDANCIELQQQARRVPNFEVIKEPANFDFQYLKPQEAATRAARDQAMEEICKKARADRRAVEQDQQRAQHEAPPPEPEPPKPQLPNGEVEVTVRHAVVPEMESEVTVRVKRFATILEVRMAILAVLNETRLSEVKLVKNTNGTFQTLKNEDGIGKRREFLAMGRKLLPVGEGGGAAAATGAAREARPQAPDAEPKKEPPAPKKEPPPASGELEVTVRHALPECASEIVVRVRRAATVMDVRDAVMKALSESRMSEVKLVQKTSSGTFATLPSDEPIGRRREFLSMGRVLRLPGPAVKEVVVNVTSTQDSADRQFKLEPGNTVRDLKLAICEMVPRGPISRVKLRARDRDLKDSETLAAVFPAGKGSAELDGMDLGPPRKVDVLVTHGTSGHSVRVTVLDTVTIGALRQAVLTTIGALRQGPVPPSSEVRIVKRLGSGGFQSLPETDRLNGRTEFDCMGRALETAVVAPPAEVAEEGDGVLTISVILDRTLGFAQELQVARGSTLLSLKELLAAGDPTHRTKPSDIRLGLPSGAPLPDGTPITEALQQLELLPGGDAAADAEASEAGAGRDGVPDISGKWTMTSEGGDTCVLVVKQAPGSATFTGTHEEVGVMEDGVISGDMVEWRIGQVTCRGRLEDGGRRLVDVDVLIDGVRYSRFNGVHQGR